MAQKPLSPEGGRGDLVAARLPRGSGDRIERVARQRGLTRSEYVRSVLQAAIEADEALKEDVRAS